MRFACQSCGKAYNLPEERIAEKSNVKLKCRVCGAIVEVKKQGEIVAQILNEGEGKRLGRVSEAPTPLMSMSPDDADDDDATSAIAVGDHGPSDQQLNDFSLGDSSEHMHIGQSNRGLPFVPPVSPTGFGAMPPPLSQDDFEHDLQGGGFQDGAFQGSGLQGSGLQGSGLQGSGLQGSGLQDAFQPNPMARPEAAAAPAYASGSLAPPPVPRSAPPPPLRSLDATEAIHNGSNGSARQTGEAALGGFADAVRAPVASTASAVLPAVDMGSMPPAPMPRADDTRSKMMAALVTGMLIGFIIAKLFF